MFRLSMILLILNVVCALALVTTQHKAREYYGDYERERKKTQELEVEYGRLQLEQSTWMMSARIEEVALNRLQMMKPTKKQTETIVLPKALQTQDEP